MGTVRTISDAVNADNVLPRVNDKNCLHESLPQPDVLVIGHATQTDQRRKRMKHGSVRGAQPPTRSQCRDAVGQATVLPSSAVLRHAHLLAIFDLTFD